ncbi:MAG: type II secretion system F family protein [Candidatus Omnitrophica bacterium]|nr:type II secretion system F family protein [Candidatus Omnitrophota bacterium]
MEGFLFIVMAILIGAAFVSFFLFLFPKAPDTISIFDKEVRDKRGSNLSPVLGLFAPFNKVLLKSFRMENALNKKIYIAQWLVTPGELLAGKELLSVVIPLVMYLLGVPYPYMYFLGFIIGWFLPDVMLNSRVKKRKYQIVRMLPETIDLLGLCVGAGLDFMSAVRWVVDKVKMNPMIEELSMVLKEINVGKPRVEALRAMSRRLDISDVTSFVRVLIQADRMGTPVEDTFRILSEDTRIRRFHRGERQAMKAPLKMLIPLIFCILPVILIIIAGPILIRFIKQGAFGGM